MLHISPCLELKKKKKSLKIFPLQIQTQASLLLLGARHCSWSCCRHLAPHKSALKNGAGGKKVPLVAPWILRATQCLKVKGFGIRMGNGTDAWPKIKVKRKRGVLGKKVHILWQFVKKPKRS